MGAAQATGRQRIIPMLPPPVTAAPGTHQHGGIDQPHAPRGGQAAQRAMRSSATAGPPSALAILAEFGGALLGGVLMALLLAVVVGLLLVPSDLGMGVLTLQVYAGIIGFALGGGVGAALVGRWMRQGGSLWLAMLGGLLSGALVAVGVRALSLPVALPPTLGIAALVALAGAVMGYNLRRRPPQPDPSPN